MSRLVTVRGSIRRSTFRILAVAAACAAAALFLGPLPTQAADAKTAPAKPRLQAGAATSNITPWLGEGIVGGWSAPPAQHIHDELHARCLVLDDGTTRIALVLADSVGIPREVFDDAKRQLHEHADLDPSRVLMAATHTHSATSSRPRNVLAPEAELNDYQRFLARRIADGVRCAINNLEPAQVAWGSASVPDQVFNRRWLMKPGTPLPNPFGGLDRAKMNPGQRNPALLEPSGPVDPQVCFLSVQSTAGRPIALLANYSLHYVGGTGPRHISADYFAVFADRVQQLLDADRLDPPFVGIMSNGTSGNINNINFAGEPERRKPYEKMRIVANQVAEAVVAASGKQTHRSDVTLDMRQQLLQLAVRKPTAEQLQRAKDLLAAPERPDNLPHERTYAERTLLQAESPDQVEVVLQTLRIGELGIAAIPFETFVETGLELKARSAFKPTFTISLANGTYGYLPTPEQHELGGYETWLGTNKVEKEASSKIRDALLGMFEEMRP